VKPSSWGSSPHGTLLTAANHSIDGCPTDFCRLHFSVAPLLTQDLLPGTVVQADILCTNNTLYQGNNLAVFHEGGRALRNHFCQKPRRFDRDPYLKAKNEGANPRKKSTGFLSSQHLYFFADKIVNMNLSYVTVAGTKASLAAVEKISCGRI